VNGGAASMSHHPVLGWTVVALLLVSPVMRGMADAQTLAIRPGEEKEICAGVKALVTPAAAKFGELLTRGDPKSDTAVQIFYKAKDTDAPVSETLICTVGTETREVAINVTPSRNGTSGFSQDAYPEAFKALFLLFVIAIVLESALAILFNWRPFVETFNSRAVKPLVSMLVASVLVYMFRIDLITSLARLISPNVPALDDTGRILTAMVIAGGSAGINNLMVGLGVRQQHTAETVAPRPPRNTGWISVAIVRTAAIRGPVTVAIGEADGTTHQVPVVASLEGSTRPGFRYFLRDKGRFPGSGGYAIAKGTNVTVKATAEKADGSGTLTKTWGAHTIADGAIVDLVFTMSE
jgi:hypothetical protein